MADFFKWDPATLALKVKPMDDEHIILIQKMNALYAAFETKASAEKVTPILNDFVDYAVRHFSDEEAFMEKIQYDGIGSHKAIHKQLLKEVTKHVEAFKKSGQLTMGFFKFLEVWLMSHIKGIDIQYARHSHQKAG